MRKLNKLINILLQSWLKGFNERLIGRNSERRMTEWAEGLSLLISVLEQMLEAVINSANMVSENPV